MRAGQAAAEGYIGAVAAVVGVAAGGGVRPGRDRQAAPGGRERAKNLLWAAGKLADYAIGAGPGRGAGGAAAPVDSGAVHPVRAGLVRRGAADAAHQPAVHRPPGRPAAVSGGRAAAAGAVQAAVQPGGDRRVPRAGGRPAHDGAADAGGGAGLPGGRRRADPRRPARRARHRRGLPVRRGDRRRSAARAPARCRCWPATTRRLLAAARFAGNGLVCGGTDPGRRNITNPLVTALDGGGGLPRLDTSRLRATWLRRLRGAAGAGHVHARGRDQLLPAARRPGRRAWSPAGEAEAVRLLGAARRHDPAGGARGDHRRLRRRAADRGHAPDRGAPPAAERPHAAGRHVPDPGRQAARPPHPRPPGADQPARGRGSGGSA